MEKRQSEPFVILSQIGDPSRDRAGVEAIYLKKSLLDPKKTMLGETSHQNRSASVRSNTTNAAAKETKI